MSVTLSLAVLGFLQVLRSAVQPRGEPQGRDRGAGDPGERPAQRGDGRPAAQLHRQRRSTSTRSIGQALIRDGQPGEPAAAAGRRAAASRPARDHRELPRGPDRFRPGRATSTARTGCSSAAGPGASSTGRRRSRPTSRSASSRRASRRTRRTSTSPSSPSTRSRTSSPSGPAILGLLNEEQQRLSRALQLRWELTRSYWATMATFGDGPAVAAGRHPLAHHRRGRVRLLHPAGHLAGGEGPGPGARHRHRAGPDRHWC